MRNAFACLVCIAAWLASGPVRAGEEAGGTAAAAQPQTRSQAEADIERLLLLQDAAAQGSIAAVDEQKRLLRSVDKALGAASGHAASPPATTVAAYVLSGGGPQVAERLAKAQDISARDRRLLKAVAAFMRGNRPAAAGLMAKLDPLQLPARIAGRMALAQALLAQEDARQEHYAVALSAMPGTAIEESALRRSALAYADAQNEAAFWRRLERYARRFPASVYRESFWADVTAKIVTWTAKGPGPDLKTLDRVLVMLPAGERRRIYVALARQSAAMAIAPLTAFAAARIERLSEGGSAEDQLASFYLNLFKIVSPEGDEALRKLRSIRPDLLGPQERALLQAALAVGGQIDRPGTPAGSSIAADKTEPDAREQRGSSLLAATSKLIGELD
ncbi:MAG: hypothetical protein IOC82_10295 [Aestuariivirga sp.]|uniref:hypothetical protein n=1 Tax=Aestuariivirga sp. TaxID=2650926 RepID=UPI0025BFB006|nr:hypothetical protein [Aestuariivirga sp.]MCA3561401.1 hypothetical protein [Aestuariivirga sp.]